MKLIKKMLFCFILCLIILAVTIELMGPGVLAVNSSEFTLDPDSLPENWNITNTVVLPENNLSAFSKKLNGQIAAIYNYMLDCQGTRLQVNVLTAVDDSEASKIYNMMLSMKSGDYLKQENNLVIEYISQNLSTVKKAKKFLQFHKIEPRSVSASPEGRYLNENYAALKVGEGAVSGLEMIDDSLAGKELFVTAEVHGLAVNQQLEFEFLKYFQENAGIKYYLQELPYSTSMLLNNYLASGDEEILKKVYSPLKGTYEWTQEKYDHWQKVYEYNRTLPPEQKIIVLGFDIEHQLENAFWYLNTILPEKEAPETIDYFINEIRTIYRDSKYEQKMTRDFTGRLLGNINKYEKIYRDYLGTDFFGFDLVSQNIIYRDVAYKKRENEWNSTRDEMMYENFLKIYDQYPAGKFYGQWGLNHAFQQKQGGVNWFAARLDNEKDSPLKGKILSIVYLYQDCEHILNGNYRNDFLTTYVSKNRAMDQLGKGDITLFKLNGANSPYTQGLIWPLVVEKPEAGSTTDYFQYVILLKNSGPSTPLNQ